MNIEELYDIRRKVMLGIYKDNPNEAMNIVSSAFGDNKLFKQELLIEAILPINEAYDYLLKQFKEHGFTNFELVCGFADDVKMIQECQNDWIVFDTKNEHMKTLTKEDVATLITNLVFLNEKKVMDYGA